MKNISFLYENFQFLEVKFSIYLNRPAFVMILLRYKNITWIYHLSGDMPIIWGNIQ